MRRLWAHLIIAFTALVLVATSFAGIFVSSTSNLEYSKGETIIYRLTDKDDREADIVEEDANKTIANEMAKRLDNIGITAYKISTSGNDFIKVDIGDSTSVSKSNIINYLSFNGSLGLSNMDDNDNYYHITGEEFLLKGSSTYLAETNNYPSIVIPTNVDNANFKLLLENTKTQHENGIGEKGEAQEEGAEATVTTYLYLWYDFDEKYDRYSRTVQSDDNPEYDEKIAQKIMMKFNIESPWFDDGQENKLCATLNLDTDGDQTLSYLEIKQGYDNARFYVNLLNASTLDYDVNYINDSYTIYSEPWTEVLVSSGNFHLSLSWSRTLIATLISILACSLLLIVFYKLSALSIGVCTLLSAFASVGFLVTLGAEFNIAALVGVILVAIGSLACGIIYASKLKDEAYKGRSLKKANSEASKKVSWPTLDISLVIVIIGAFAYLFGGSFMRSFAITTILGGIFVLLINLILLKIMMWLATNTTKFTGRYDLFGIDNKKVPSIANEEKQTYFSSFDGRDFTKHKKSISIGFIVFGLLSVAGLIVSANLYKGQYFTDKTVTQSSEIYFYTEYEDSTITQEDYIRNSILDKTFLKYDDGKTEDTKLSSLVKNIYTFTHNDKISGVEVNTTYVVAQFDVVINPEQNAYFISKPTAVNTLNYIINDVLVSDDPSCKATVNTVSNNIKSTNNNSGIMLGTVVATLVLGVYFMIRYKLSRGITAIIAPLFVTACSVGLFSLISLMQASLPSTLSLLLPVVAALALITSVIWMSKERDLILDDKDRQSINTMSRREEIYKKNNCIAFSTISVFASVVLFLSVIFFGFGPLNNSLVFVGFAVGIGLSTLFVSVLFGISSHLIYKKLAEKNISIKPKKAKKIGNIKPNRSSGEPEEAIFIGIND